ncbi:MAG TPA: decarboxylating 6-phosphogluconate dehydrogenase [Dehalococcoidia bacterium]|nr:decarboxylating 6-phosphogluconate dehydrogenase [Dehalococcoidia bacterium]
MKLGFVGLGRMGGNMTRRLLEAGHEIVAWNQSPEPLKTAVERGALAAEGLEDLMLKLEPPRVVWIMVPSGDPVDATIDGLLPFGKPGDIVIDGGNSNYKQTLERGDKLESHGFEFIDAGTSGGIWGYEVGYCLMVGGKPEVFKQVEPIFQALAPKKGYALLGPRGAGHFAKMVHNGIEYGMLQAYAEGFEIMDASPYDYDMGAVAQLWNQGSVVRSWLLELAELAFKEDPTLEKLEGYVEDSGEGRWTVAQAIDTDVPAPVITLALLSRFYSRQQNSFGHRVIAALRNQFGGHKVVAATLEDVEKAQ